MSKTHENFSRNKIVLGKPSNRLVGLIISSIIVIISIWPSKNGDGIITEGVILSIILIILSLSLPIVFSPISLILQKFSTLLRIVINPTVLLFLYIFAVIPSGIYLRITGKDPMKIKLDKNAKTYWINRDPPGPEPKSLEKQF